MAERAVQEVHAAVDEWLDRDPDAQEIAALLEALKRGESHV